MKYWIATFLALAVAALGVALASHVPGAMEGSHFTREFWLNGYFIVMGFVVTTAAVSPLVALFVDWRSNVAWRAARLNARRRLATALREAMSGYHRFLTSVASDQLAIAPFELDTLTRALADFFDTYDGEQATFNAEMHSKASRLRQRLLPFRRGLESTLTMIHAKRSFRFYVGQTTLNDLRAVFDKPTLSATGILANRPYFAQHGELFADVRLDAHLGSSVIPIHPFAPLDLAQLRREWTDFVSACPGRANDDDARVSIDVSHDDAAQRLLHAKYARATIHDSHMLEAVLPATTIPRKESSPSAATSGSTA